jgi:hypothetical protein
VGGAHVADTLTLKPVPKARDLEAVARMPIQIDERRRANRRRRLR